MEIAPQSQMQLTQTVVSSGEVWQDAPESNYRYSLQVTEMDFNKKQKANLQSMNTEIKAARKFHEVSINIFNQKNFSVNKREKLIAGS